jgi:hypothetical protein
MIDNPHSGLLAIAEAIKTEAGVIKHRVLADLDRAVDGFDALMKRRITDGQ